MGWAAAARAPPAVTATLYGRSGTAVDAGAIGRGGDGGAGGGGGTGGGGGAQPMSLIGQSQGVPGIMRRSGRPSIGAPASDAMTPVKLDVPVPPSPV